MLYRFYFDLYSTNTNIIGWQSLEEFLFFCMVKYYPSSKHGFIRSSELDNLAKHCKLSRTTLVKRLKANPYFTYVKRHGYKIMSWQRVLTKNNIKSKYRVLEADNCKDLLLQYVNVLAQSTKNQVAFKDNNQQTILNSIRLSSLKKKMEVLSNKRRKAIAIVEVGHRTQLMKGVFAKMKVTDSDVSKLADLMDELEQNDKLRIIRGLVGNYTASGQANIYVWNANEFLPKKIKGTTYAKMMETLASLNICLTPAKVRSGKPRHISERRRVFNIETESDADLVDAFYAKLLGLKQFLIEKGIIQKNMSKRSISSIIGKMKNRGMQYILDKMIDPSLVRSKTITSFFGGLDEEKSYETGVYEHKYSKTETRYFLSRTDKTYKPNMNMIYWNQKTEPMTSVPDYNQLTNDYKARGYSMVDSMKLAMGLKELQY